MDKMVYGQNGRTKWYGQNGRAYGQNGMAKIIIITDKVLN